MLQHLQPIPGESIRIRHYPSPFGKILLGHYAHRICFLYFLDTQEKTAQILKKCRTRYLAYDFSENEAEGPFIDSRQTLLNLYEGLSVQASDFQMAVWEALLRVPAGRVISYSEFADTHGFSGKIRAVAHAIAQNEVAWIIPCHRIIPKSQPFPGQYRWGPELKAALLRSEKQ